MFCQAQACGALAKTKFAFVVGMWYNIIINQTKGNQMARTVNPNPTPITERTCQRGHFGNYIVRKNNQGVVCKDCLTLASVKFRAVRGMKTYESRKPQVAIAISDLVAKQAQIKEQLQLHTTRAEKQLNEIEVQIALLQKQVS
jgi:hypothetical protein